MGRSEGQALPELVLANFARAGTGQFRDDPEVLWHLEAGKPRLAMGTKLALAVFVSWRQDDEGMACLAPAWVGHTDDRHLKNGGMFGKDAKMMEQMMGGGGMGMPMQMPQLAPGYTAPMGQAAMAKARLMGYAAPGQPAGKPEDKKKLQEKRKLERQAREKNRRE